MLEHLTEKQKRDLLMEMATQTLGLEVEDKQNPPGAHIDTWDILKKSIPKRGIQVLTPIKCRYNTAAILRADPEFDTLVYDEHSDSILWKGELITDVHIEMIALDMENRYRYQVQDTALRASMVMVAYERKIEPIKDWLEGLESWDGVPRIEPFFQDVFHAKVPDGCEMLMAEMSVKWFLSCVARVMSPGCKMDTCMVLVGDKGLRKSTALKTLAGESWFSDSNINISHKDSYELLHQSGVWIWELAEMHALQGKTAANAKQFLTSASDRYRPAYGKMPVQRDRRTVFTASTNDFQFLSDGPERRFWIVEVQAPIDIDYIVDNRSQIWAEALHWYRDGVAWWLTPESDEVNAQYQQSFIIDDPWTVKVLECLKLHNGQATTRQIMDHLELGPSHQHTGNSKRIGQILRDCGYGQFYCGEIKGRKWRVKGVN